MASRIVSVRDMGGHSIDMEFELQDLTCWRIMRRIKITMGIPMKDQKIMLNEKLLRPKDRLPDDVDIDILLMQVVPYCMGCEKEVQDRQMYFCSRCLQVLYCNTICQKKHWAQHRQICKKK